ncbi:phospholipase D family protein [Histidinibacterium lentulum]|uniref:Phospholipase n=1 Tax=Histidinibacterium lentulum TaxID=2480588 RepID=A0A3N2R8K2_9RHOB|nr:phospholipase D-like domain-containing protein [Histidinibacterium lentulum]ROU03757.1 phospholipase [Histidinibacterium lentulum]
MTPIRPLQRLQVTDAVRAVGDWVQRRRAIDADPPPPRDADKGPLPDLKVLITAEEAFPEFERLVLAAETSVTCGFRIFDPTTRLLSEEARAIGETWADLIAHVLCRGVRVRMRISDFDPVAVPDLHRTSWQSLRLLRERAAEEGCSDLLDAEVCLHPAQAGRPVRRAFAATARKSLRDIADHLNAQGAARRDDYMKDAPGLGELLDRDENGDLFVQKDAVPPMRPVTHHQKVAVIDRRCLYIGGLDLDDRRADDKDHDRAGSRTWADVQLSLTGPIAAEAEDHLLAFTDEVARRTPIAPSRPGLLRTLSLCATGRNPLQVGPDEGLCEILDRTLEGVAGATDFIYLETQFLRDLHFSRDLARRGARQPDLGLIVVLPSAPEELAFQDARGMDMRFGEHLQARCLEILRRAFGDRLTVVSPAQTRGAAPDGTRAVLCGAPVIYVHSKVSIFDDRLAVVSSANLNGRSHHWDTELGVALTDRAQILHLRDRVMRHWLPPDPDPALLDPATAPKAWRDLAKANRDTQPARRTGYLLPYPWAAPRRFGRPIPFLTQNMV